MNFIKDTNKKWYEKKGFIILAVLILIVLIGNLGGNNEEKKENKVLSKEDSLLNNKLEKIELAKRNPEKYLIIKKSSWRRGGFDAIALHNIDLINSSPIPLKDIEIQIDYYSESLTKIQSKTEIIYKIALPGKTLKIRDFNSGFVNSQASTCGITVVSATPP